MFALAVWIRLGAYSDVTLAGPEERVRRTDAPAPLDDVAALPPDPGMIVETDSAGKELTPAAAKARDERYRELLNQPPPPPPTPPQAPKQSLFDRVMSPIASALGRDRKEKAPPARPASQPSSQASPRASSPTPPPRQEGSGTSDKPTGTVHEDDPETDLVPPMLLSVVFNPPEVSDGGETQFAAVIEDNRSGVRSVSGVINSPSGSMQGFSARREGETNRFIAQVRVPKEAPEGTWIVRYLTLTDNAGNSVNLNQGQGSLPDTASFKVVSPSSDATGPQLKAIWLDRPAMRSGEKNTVFVNAEDDKVGVSLVSGIFVSPSKNARLGFGCRPGSGGTWECPLTPPSCLDCGLWRLEQVQLQDKANNLATFRADSPVVAAVIVDIAGELCDNAPPVVTMVNIDPLVISNAQASTVQVTATVQDDGPCGAASLSGQVIPPAAVGGQRHPIIFVAQPDGRTFLGTVKMPQFAAKGQWSVTWLQAQDKGYNMRAYSAHDPVISRATFTVE